MVDNPRLLESEMTSGPATPEFIPTLSSELQLLLLCSCKELNGDRLARAEKLVAGTIDWKSFLDLAFFHRVAPLVFRNLKLHLWGAVPEEEGGSLANFFMENQRRMMFLTSELIRIIHALRTESIEVIALKGPVLSASVYENVAMRSSGDLDILVRGGDLPLALDVLRRCGYRVYLGDSIQKVSANQELAIRRFHYHYILYNEALGHTVELHFRLFGGKLRWGPTTDEAFADFGTCTIAGEEIGVLNDRENFIYLCLHGGKYAWSRLEWITTMAELLRRMEGVDEDELWSYAERRCAGPALLLGISLADRYFGICPFQALRDKAQARSGIEKLSVKVDELLENTGLVNSGEKIASRFHWELCGTLRRRIYLYFSRKLIPNCADVARADWSPMWRFLYYIGPLRRLLSRAGGTVRGERLHGE